MYPQLQGSEIGQVKSSGPDYHFDLLRKNSTVISSEHAEVMSQGNKSLRMVSAEQERLRMQMETLDRLKSRHSNNLERIEERKQDANGYKTHNEGFPIKLSAKD